MDQRQRYGADDNAHAAPEAADDTAARARRDSLFLMAPLFDADGNAIGRGRVRNISASGMLIETESGVTSGMIIVAALRNIGDVRGTAAWVRNGRVGIAFDEPVDPQQVRKPVTEGRQRQTPPGYLKPVAVLPRRIA